MLGLRAEGLDSGGVSAMESRMKKLHYGLQKSVGRLSAGQNSRILENY